MAELDRIFVHELSHAQFIEHYFLPQKPVIITGCTECWPAFDWSHSNIHRLLQRDEGDKLRQVLPTWYEPTRKSSIWKFTRNTLNCDVRKLGSINRRRLWLSPKGKYTPFHYDAGGVHIFNTQVTGRKRWRLIDPQTPLPVLPFKHHCLGNFEVLADSSNTLEYKVFVCELRAGDTLFLPAYWIHAVLSLEEENVNTDFYVWNSSVATRCALQTRGQTLFNNIFRHVDYTSDKFINSDDDAVSMRNISTKQSFFATVAVFLHELYLLFWWTLLVASRWNQCLEKWYITCNYTAMPILTFFLGKAKLFGV